MKILHIIPSYLPAVYASGPIKPTHYLNKMLVKKGVDVVVYTMNFDGERRLDVPLEKEVNLDGVKVYYFPMTFRPWQYSYKLHRALVKNIKNFDLIHITSVFLSTSTLGTYYARKYKIPYIISPHGSLMDEPLRFRSFKKWLYVFLFERRNLKNASAIHFVVEAEKEDYLKTSLPFKKSIVIPNCFDTEKLNQKSQPRLFREKINLTNDKKVILFLGRLSWIKGLDTLIPAFAEVVKKEPKTILILVGPDEGGYKKEIIKMIENSRLIYKDLDSISINQLNQYKSAQISINQRVNIIFTGMLTGVDKIVAFQESDIFILPSYSENFGMAVVEAMYFGLPVVITKNVGISPSVEKAQAGLVINKDENQLVEAILKILNNPDLAKKMGENGKKLVREEFNSDKIADKWINEYKMIIKNV